VLEDGDRVGATWHRILDAIERLQAKAPAEGGEDALRHAIEIELEARRASLKLAVKVPAWVRT